MFGIDTRMIFDTDGKSVNQKFIDISSVNANAEVLAARGTYPTLAPRLDNVDVSLADKANKSDIATFATSNGTNDNTNFISWIANSNKIYIPPNVTLKLGYTASGSYISINKPIEIYGGGTIDFIGDFSVNALFKVSSNNVTFRGINFTNNTGTVNPFANGFINTVDNTSSNLLIEFCTFTNGCITISRASNCIVRYNTINNSGMVLIGGNNNRVERNIVNTPTSTTSTGMTGINLLSYSGDIAKDWYVGNNTITNVCYSGITFQCQSGFINDCMVEGNTIKVAGNTGTTNLIPISIVGGYKVTVRNNDIFSSNYNGHYYGIECINNIYGVIEGNRIEGMANGIVVNGTATGLSRNNLVQNNTILNWLLIGIHVYRYTSGNMFRNNTLNSTTVSTTANAYGIYLEADAKSEFQLNQCYYNTITIDASSMGSVTKILGIQSNAPRCKIKDNIITMKGPNNAVGIYMYCGDNFGMNYGKNMDVSNNEVMLYFTSVSNVYGIQVNHTNSNDSLTNTIIQYNRINVLAPTGTTPWIASTAYALNATVFPTSPNGFYYTCTTAGTTGSTPPTFPSAGSGYTVTDGTVVWTSTGGGKQFYYVTSKVDNGIVTNNFNA